MVATRAQPFAMIPSLALVSRHRGVGSELARNNLDIRPPCSVRERSVREERNRDPGTVRCPCMVRDIGAVALAGGREDLVCTSLRGLAVADTSF